MASGTVLLFGLPELGLRELVERGDRAHALAAGEFLDRRQYLDPRGSADAVDVISRLCGVQAQVKSSAELAVRLRQAEPKAGQVEDGIADRTLVKTWAMRGTLHLLRGCEAGFFLSLIATARTWSAPAWQRAFGATPTEIEALVDIVSEALDGTVLTRDELVTKIVATKGFAKLEEQLRSGWGAILKPLAWQGALSDDQHRAVPRA